MGRPGEENKITPGIIQGTKAEYTNKMDVNNENSTYQLNIRL
eukprot:COSAG05_NODE_839_length_7033_cov_12.960485_3_plen_42_part_00